MLQARAFVVAALIAITLVAVASTSGAAPRGVPRQTPGFDGKTIKVSGLGFAANFADSAVGAEARFNRANETNELKGVTIEFGDFADDKNDAATSVSEARRLVEQENVFAIVPLISASAPGDYLNQRKVPFFGWGFDKAYCGPGDKLYGFGYSGCVLPPNPTKVPDFSAGNPYRYLTQEKGIKNPTIAGIGTDTPAGKTSMKSFIAQATGSGFKVVWAQAVLPPPPAVTGDYSPYVQEIMTADNGEPPDAFFLAAGLQDALNMPKAFFNAGYEGMLISAYYSDALVRALDRTFVAMQFAPFEQNTAGIRQMREDVLAVKADAKPTTTMAAGYFAADFFVKAVKKTGTKNLTREALQKTAAHMTYQIKGTVGPTQYPRAFQALNSYCTGLVQSDGTAFSVVEPFTCTNHFTPVKKNSPDEVG
jgi:ABC-type branched-subunit amino acid transport system substrate-binding protein